MVRPSSYPVVQITVDHLLMRMCDGGVELSEREAKI